MSTAKQDFHYVESGILIMSALAVIEFGSNFGLSPGLSQQVFEYPTGEMISSFLILGFIMGILGFLTYSKVSLISGSVSCAIEALIGLLVLSRIVQGAELELLLQDLGVLALSIPACYIGVYSTVKLTGDMIDAQVQLHERISPVVLEITGLKKYYQIGELAVKALDGVSFSVKRGEMIAIMGPSGSGKSTLLNMIGLLDSPTSGSIKLDGNDVSEMDSIALANERNSKIGFIFQSYNLINRSSVLKNVELPAIVNTVTSSDRTKRAKEYLELLGLEEEIYRKPTTLSGGQQQRVAIARSLMNSPSIILADEPTGNLDSKSGTTVMDILKKLNKERGMTVILVTHDREIGDYANRIFYLRDGLIVQTKVAPDEITI